jgi:hypothetical protein
MTETKNKLTLDRPETYQIRVPGALDETCLDWIGGVTVTIESDRNNESLSILTTTVDQAALQGLLRNLYSLGLPLISVIWVNSG